MKNKIRFLFGMFLAILLGGAYRVYQSRARNRIPSIESMDNPSVAGAFNRISSWPQMRLLRWYVARRIAHLAQEGQAVDIGCGPGHLVFKLARVAPSLRLTGIDLSEEVLVQAKTTAHNYGLGDVVKFKKGSAQEIPFPDSSLDLVVSTLSLHHWKEPIAVLDEVSRVLRPGGAFLIFDLRRDMAPPFYILIWFATRFIVPNALRLVNEPLGSRDAAYTVQEAWQLAANSKLSGWQVTSGPLWMVIEGKTTNHN